MKVLLTLLTLLTLGLGTACAAAPAPLEPLPSLISTALTRNPELKSSQARWQMYLAKARQSGSLDDPMVMFKLQNLLVRDPLSFGGRDPTTAKVIGISQELPFWGKRALRQEVARHEADAYRWSIEERKQELARLVKEAYYRLYAVDKGLAIVAKNLKIMHEFTSIAEARYAVGKGTQADIFKAGLESSKLLEQQITLQQQRTSLAASLNYLLDRPPTAPVGEVSDFDLPVMRQSPEALLTVAEEQRPQVKNLDSRISRGIAAHALARRERWPDLTLSLEYMFRQPVNNTMTNDPGYDMFSVGLTFNLPIHQGRRQAMQAESSSETTMAAEELHDLKNRIRYEIRDNLAQMDRDRRLVTLYRSGIIPQAEQALASALIGYQVGKVDFLTLLDNRVTLFNYEQGLFTAKAAYMRELATLEAVVGEDLQNRQRPDRAATVVP